VVRGLFGARHNHSGGGHISNSVAHSFDMLALHSWMLAHCVSYSMANGDKSVMHMEMAAIERTHYTCAGGHTHLFVSQID
jgi:hypothetical protein